MNANRTILVVLLTGFLAVPIGAAERRRGPQREPDEARPSVRLESPDAARQVAEALEVLLQHHPIGQDLRIGTGDDGRVWVRGEGPLADLLTEAILQPMAEKPRKAAKAPRNERPAKRERRSRGGRSQELEVRVFQLMFADADIMERHVAMLKIGTRDAWAVASDQRTNTVIVKGAPQLIAEAELLIDQLDRPADRETAQVMKLVPLSNTHAVELAKVVSRAFSATDRRGPNPLELVAEQRTNTILVAGPEHMVAQASTLLRTLDERARTAPPRREKGPAAKKEGKPKKKQKTRPEAKPGDRQLKAPSPPAKPEAPKAKGHKQHKRKPAKTAKEGKKAKKGKPKPEGRKPKRPKPEPKDSVSVPRDLPPTRDT